MVPTSPPTRRDGWTAERQLRFLDALARTGSIVRAAASTGMSRESAYRLRRRSPLFAALWDRALKGHKMGGLKSRTAPKIRGNPPKVTKWKKWKDPGFQPLREQLCDLLISSELRLKRPAVEFRLAE